MQIYYQNLKKVFSFIAFPLTRHHGHCPWTPLGFSWIRRWNGWAVKRCWNCGEDSMVHSWLSDAIQSWLPAVHQMSRRTGLASAGVDREAVKHWRYVWARIRDGSIYRTSRDASPISILAVSYRIGALDVGFSIYGYRITASVTTWILIIFRYRISRLFDVHLKTNNYISKSEYPVLHCDTCNTSTSTNRKLTT